MEKICNIVGMNINGMLRHNLLTLTTLLITFD